MPNMYAREILFGKMVIELGDTSTAHYDAQNLNADLECKIKGVFSGAYTPSPARWHGPTDLGEVRLVERADGVQVHQCPSPPLPLHIKLTL